MIQIMIRAYADEMTTTRQIFLRISVRILLNLLMFIKKMLIRFLLLAFRTTILKEVDMKFH